MKKSEIADIVEKTVDFLERTGADRLAQQYLNFALTGFAAGCEEQLAHYLLRYDIQAQKLQAETAQLLVHNDEEALACFVLDSFANLIGRVDPQTRSYPNVDLTAFDSQAKISRRHAKIYSFDGKNFWIEDLGSYNGTLLNGTRLTNGQPKPLHDGDRILFGNIAVGFASPVVGRAKPNLAKLKVSVTRQGLKTGEYPAINIAKDKE